MSRNRAPWRVPTTASWGVRTNFSRPRRAMPRVLAGRPADRGTGTGTVVMVSLLSGRRMPGGLVDGLAGQGQEDLVQGRGPQRDVVDRDPGGVQGAEGVAQRGAAGGHGHPDQVGGLLDLGPVVVEGGQGGPGPLQVGPVAGVDLDDVAAGPGLELARAAGGH